MKCVGGYLLVFGVSTLTTFGVYLWMPSYRGYLTAEDSLIENLSAVFYLMPFMLGLLFLLKGSANRKALVAVSAVGLLGFLDEVSFGERVFGFNVPQILGVPIDGAHDFFYLGCKIIKELTIRFPVLVMICLGVGAIGATVVAFRYGYLLKETILSVHRDPPFILASFFAILVFFALVIDLDIAQQGELMMVEELLEMNAAIALLFCCMSLYGQRSVNEPTIRPT